MSKKLTTADVELRRMVRGAWLQSKTDTQLLKIWVEQNPAAAERAARHDSRMRVMMQIWRNHETLEKTKTTDAGARMCTNRSGDNRVASGELDASAKA